MINISSSIYLPYNNMTILTTSAILLTSTVPVTLSSSSSITGMNLSLLIFSLLIYFNKNN